MYDNNGSHRSSDLFRLVKPFLALHFLIYIIATFFLGGFPMFLQVLFFHVAHDMVAVQQTAQLCAGLFSSR
jgi:hypothetical protein